MFNTRPFHQHITKQFNMLLVQRANPPDMHTIFPPYPILMELEDGMPQKHRKWNATHCSLYIDDHVFDFRDGFDNRCRHNDGMGRSARHKLLLIFVVGFLTMEIAQLLFLAMDTYCGDYLEKPLAHMVLMNNVWNQDSTTGIQCVLGNGFKQPQDKAVLAWAWMNRADSTPHSSPSIAYGFVPWRKTSTTDKLPLRLSAIRTMNVNYDFLTHGDGLFETALTLYLTTSGKPTPQNLHTEILIWLVNHGRIPWGNYRGNIIVDGTQYGLWTSKIDTWNLVALMPRSFTASKTINLRHCFTALIKQGHLDERLYLASVQLGNNIISGTGYTIIKAFDVDSTKWAGASH